MQLEHLMEELDKFALKAFELDKRRGDNSSHLFDKQLFSCSSKKLTPCVQEAKKNLNALIQYQELSQQNPQRAIHLCEKLLHQVSALQRELSTVSLRNKERQSQLKPRENLYELKRSLAQHQAWEKQLADNVKIAEQNLIACQDIILRQQKQLRLLACEKRVTKCMQARQKIENRLHFLERKG